MPQPKVIYRQYGAKTSIAKWIVSHFPEHKIYLEPFCGSCSVLFAKEPSFIEIVNDMDENLITLFEELRKRPFELAALLWATPYSTANWREQPVEDIALEKARQLLAAGVQTYCCKQHARTWAIDKCSAPHKQKPNVWADWFQRVLPAAVRLKDVQLLCEDACKAIARVYQQEDALIYCDPPYRHHEDEYFHKVDYEKFAGLVKEAKAKVVVSEYETAAHYFEGWHRVSITKTGRTATATHGKGRKATKKEEFLFCNFLPDAQVQETA